MARAPSGKGHISVFTSNPTLFTPASNEEEADRAADEAFVSSIEVAEQHYVYEWPEVAENLACTGFPSYSEHMAEHWESYAQKLLG